MKAPHFLGAAVVGALLLCGCQTARPLYYWGNYETVLYQSYAAPGKHTPAEHIDKLKADIEKAAATNQKVPPGLHAHLGLLYYQTGQTDLALKEFETEKALFPESTAFIDGLLKQQQKNSSKG